MRLVATVIVLCLILSPVAYASDRTESPSGIVECLGVFWELLEAIPEWLVEKNELGASGDQESVDDAPVHPPETEAGPMIIVDG